MYTGCQPFRILIWHIYVPSSFKSGIFKYALHMVEQTLLIK